MPGGKHQAFSNANRAHSPSVPAPPKPEADRLADSRSAAADESAVVLEESHDYAEDEPRLAISRQRAMTEVMKWMDCSNADKRRRT